MDDAEPDPGTGPGPSDEDPLDSGVIRDPSSGHRYAFQRVNGHAPPRWAVFPIPLSTEIGWTTDTDPDGW